MLRSDNGDGSLNVLALYSLSMQILTELKEIQLPVTLRKVC